MFHCQGGEWGLTLLACCFCCVTGSPQLGVCPCQRDALSFQLAFQMEAQIPQAFDMVQLCDCMMVLRVVECQDGLSHMYDPPNT